MKWCLALNFCPWKLILTQGSGTVEAVENIPLTFNGLKVGRGIEQWSYTLKLSWKTQTSLSDFYALSDFYFSGITVWVNDTVIEPSISHKCIQYLYPCLYSLSIGPSPSTEISPSARDSGLKLDLFNHQQHHLLQCHSNGTTMRQRMPTSTIPLKQYQVVPTSWIISHAISISQYQAQCHTTTHTSNMLTTTTTKGTRATTTRTSQLLTLFFLSRYLFDAIALASPLQKEHSPSSQYQPLTTSISMPNGTGTINEDENHTLHLSTLELMIPLSKAKQWCPRINYVLRRCLEGAGRFEAGYMPVYLTISSLSTATPTP